MHAITTAELFRATWPRHTAKHAARAANGPVATAKAWVQRRFTPSADTLLRMASENQELRAELLRRLGAHGYAENGTTLDRSTAATDGRADGTSGGQAGSAAEADAVRVGGER
jgi:hypothetical protein